MKDMGKSKLMVYGYVDGTEVMIIQMVMIVIMINYFLYFLISFIIDNNDTIDIFV